MKKGIMILISTILIVSFIQVPVAAQNLPRKGLGSVAPISLSLAPEEHYIVQTVHVCDGIQLVYSLKSEDINIYTPLRSAKSVTRRKLTSKCDVLNKAGNSIGTIIAVGVFETNGSTSNPQDAYGFGEVKRYTIENTSNAKSSEQFNAWVRVSIKGVPDGPVKAFNHICVIDCDANGQKRATWN